MLVLQANLAILDIIKPMPHAKIRDSSLELFALSAYSVADHAIQLQATAKVVIKSRLAGSCTLYASSPESDRKWKRRGFLVAADFKEGMTKSTGDT